MPEYITDKIEILSGDSDREDSDKKKRKPDDENSNKKKRLRYRMCLVFIFLISQIKKVIIFKAFRLILSEYSYNPHNSYKNVNF